MSDSTALSFNQLPLEILHGIFHYLDVPDILRVRRVSRYLNGASRFRSIWSDAYRRADFVRLPGPLLSQSAHDLENALVPSFRVEQNLRHGGGGAQREKMTLKLKEIRYTGVALGVSLIFARFLFVALSEEVRCYDLSLDAFDSNSGASIIYRSTGGILRSFWCVSAIDVEGRPFACVVLSEEMQTGVLTQGSKQISVYSLNVVEQSEVTLDLLHQFEEHTFDIDVVDLGPRVIVIQGRVGPNTDTDWRLVALDVHTRTQFLLPSFTHATWEAARWGIPCSCIPFSSNAHLLTRREQMPVWTTTEDITSPTSISTSTHLLLARSFYTQAAGWCTFLQAFTLPHLNAHHHFILPSTPLSPSHQGIIPGISVSNAVLLHDATVDASTQDVFITIRVHAFEPSRPRCSFSKYGILCLDGTAHNATPSSCGELGTITLQVLGSLGRLSQIPFRHPSFNGAGRAFYMLEPGSYIVAALEYDVRGSGGYDSEARVIEYPCILRFPTPRTLWDYDPYSGRICLQSSMTKYSVIEILDLAV